MYQGFVKTAVVTPDVRVADPVFNADEILKNIRLCAEQHVKVIVFPELALTAYTCGDLFLQARLLDEARDQLLRICEETEDNDALIFIGLPAEIRGKLYNVAAVIQAGELLGLVPKTYLPNYNEFYEMRHFTAGPGPVETVDWGGEEVLFGANQLFTCDGMPHFVVAAEICEDLWAPCPPSTQHAIAGATVIVNLSASNEMVGKGTYRRNLLAAHSAACVSAILYSSAGEGESTTDLVFGGHNLIAENGVILAEAERFSNGILTAEIDVDRLAAERRRISTFPPAEIIPDEEDYVETTFAPDAEETELTRRFDPHPFVPSDEAERDLRCNEILNIQAYGLKKRMAHTHAGRAVIGISGGLDSTLALLVTARAFDLLGLPREQILAVTMPGFGTTDRTYENACTLVRRIGAELREVSIKESVMVHFRDIGQDPEKHDVTYENAQARERTQILMDLANQCGALVVGTGDLSELALGWATYNGDHMSMYGVNASVPKTLVRHLVRYYADTCGDKELEVILLDVLDTPVSPELLPPEDGKISQKTEDLVGPYELHDFFLYYMLRAGYEPSKILRIAKKSFEGVYDDATILHWLKTFCRRFFTQQFKRSCLPDGPKVGSVALSPRGDLRMPSDACMEIWLRDLEEE
ncbi:MAG: NAD(+) synthase [Eubacterium sp.]|nr:NAD(+) synthase [Eubacterium sp.]